MAGPGKQFVSLSSVRGRAPDPKAALAEIREIYFKTTKKTIEHDFDRAIELLKGLPGEEEREKATVFMEGLTEMRKEWAKGGGSGTRGSSGRGGARGQTPKSRNRNSQKR